jgi:IPT/TIG domain
VRARPVIDRVTPRTGFRGGGDIVVLEGSNLWGSLDFFAGDVAFGRVQAEVLEADNSRIVVTTPAGRGGVFITYTRDDGEQTAIRFQYTPRQRPVIASVEPNMSPLRGGALIEIAGSRLADASDVFIGQESAASLEIESEHLIRVRTPAQNMPAVVPVTVVSGIGRSLPVDWSVLEYVRFPRPEIASILPTTGDIRGGDVLTVKGRFVPDGYSGSPTVFVGRSRARWLSTYYGQRRWPDEITVISPQGSGNVFVTVMVAGIQSSRTASAEFSYEDLGTPSIWSVTEIYGARPGVRRARISGQTLSDALRVTVGRQDALNFTIRSDTTIIATFPRLPYRADGRHIRVFNSRGVSRTNAATTLFF